MTKYEIRQGKLCYGSKVLGAEDDILVESTQKDVRDFVERSQIPKVVVCKLEVGDYVFATGEGKTVALEEKRCGDFESSFSGGRRRGRRQLRECRGAADVAGLALRGASKRYSMDTEWSFSIDDAEMLVDLVKWQVLGGVVVFLPWEPEDVIARLQGLRGVLRPGNHLYSVVSGTDKKMPWVGQPEPILAFRRMVKGVGKVMGDKLWDVVQDKEDPLGWLVSCSDKEFGAIKGVHKGIVEQRRKVKSL